MDSSPVFFHQYTNLLDISRSEVLRYMGCAGRNAPTAEIIALAKKAIATIQSVAACKACYRRTELQMLAPDTVDFGFMQIPSGKLAKNLNGCKSAYLFAATIGIEADRLILRSKHGEPSYALALQAAGAAAIESYCDLLCASVLSEQAKCEGKALRPRFSAGYGDVSLMHQKQIFTALDCARKIGLTLTDSYIMSPTKSVTAFVGMGEPTESCMPDTCSACDNINCEFRMGSETL